MTKLEPGTLLLDASTVDLLSSHIIYHALTGPYFADDRMTELLHTILVRHAEHSTFSDSHAPDLYALSHALSFLEQWMLADKLIVDRRALNSLANHNRSESTQEKFRKLSALYTEADISEELSEKARTTSWPLSI